ncbi:hypothetical protein FX983_04830 [Pseudomonas frederiksbergensis]|uniref:Uncharacterized protein n=1 Tax=Pseudomonas frederiksbergensis TaxID=104087 RepID=A0A6L5BNY1_9PSED|nr:hypothetical protein FX984_04973 [Pseudomonas marginalis]KAF2390369.1 hypothetical protein FX983_04830 [Pseudomonas frederiksbergensis]
MPFTCGIGVPSTFVTNSIYIYTPKASQFRTINNSSKHSSPSKILGDSKTSCIARTFSSETLSFELRRLLRSIKTSNATTKTTPTTFIPSRLDTNSNKSNLSTFVRLQASKITENSPLPVKLSLHVDLPLAGRPMVTNNSMLFFLSIIALNSLSALTHAFFSDNASFPSRKLSGLIITFRLFKATTLLGRPTALNEAISEPLISFSNRSTCIRLESNNSSNLFFISPDSRNLSRS